MTQMPTTPAQETPNAATAQAAASPSLAPPMPVAPIVAPKPSGLGRWLFGTWVTGGNRPIAKSSSLRWSVILALVGAGAWFFSSASADAPAALKNWSPTVTGIAASFAVAFILGFVVRKVLKAVAIAALLLAALFAAAKLAGIKLDLSLLHSTTQQAFEESKSLAHRLGELSKHYLPSTFAATIGLWRGGRRDSIK